MVPAQVKLLFHKIKHYPYIQNVIFKQKITKPVWETSLFVHVDEDTLTSFVIDLNSAQYHIFATITDYVFGVLYLNKAFIFNVHFIHMYHTKYTELGYIEVPVDCVDDDPQDQISVTESVNCVSIKGVIADYVSDPGCNDNDGVLEDGKIDGNYIDNAAMARSGMETMSETNTYQDLSVDGASGHDVSGKDGNDNDDKNLNEDKIVGDDGKIDKLNSEINVVRDIDTTTK